MPFVLGPLLDPAPQDRAFLRGELAELRGLGRHPLVRIIAQYAPQQFTALRVARHDRSRVHCGVPVIQPQVSLPLIGIGTVAEETFVGQDRSHVAIEPHRIVSAQAQFAGGARTRQCTRAAHNPASWKFLG